MKIIIECIKSEYKVFFAFFYCIFTFGTIFLLADLPKEYFLLAIQIIIFGIMLYILVQCFNYRKKEKIKEKLQCLYDENEILQNRLVDEKKDLEEYFLLWVHQIKTPITVSNLILHKFDFDYAHKLKEQMFYIEKYVNMAINYLKIQNRQADMDIAPVKLNELINPLLKKYATLFIDKHISLEYIPIKDTVITDSKWFSVLLEQILANAIKYTNNGKISIFYDANKNILFIEDTGIGIRTEDLNKIFDRGYSGFNGRINEKASGLGLYLVKKISELLNIKVKANSILHKGSTFSIYFSNNLTKM